MFSKLQSATAMMGAVMISSLPKTEGQIVPPPQYDYTSALSCSQCIQAGYKYVYDSGDSNEKQYYNQIATGGDYTGFCCTTLADGRIDCNDELMWSTWTSTVTQEEVETFNTNLGLYFAAFGLEDTRSIVAELYQEQAVKITTSERKYFYLGLSGRITIAHSQDGWNAEIQSDDDINDPDSTILTDLISDIETLSADDMLGDLFRKSFSQDLIANFDTFSSQSITLITLAQVVSLVQDKVDVLKAAMEIEGVDENDVLYTQYIQDIFVALYGDEGLVKYYTAENFDAYVINILDSIQESIDLGDTAYDQFELTLTNVETDLQIEIDGAVEEEDEEIENDVQFTAVIPEIYNEIMDQNDIMKKNSDLFASLEVAMHACPQKEDICGSRMIMNTGEDIEIDLEGISNLDSCHILVTTTCGLPEIEFTTNTLGANFKMDFVEFQDGYVEMNTKADADDADSMFDYYPDNMATPHYIKGYSNYFGELPNLIEELPWTVDQLEGLYKYQIPLARITEHLIDHNDIVDVYKTDIATYLEDKSAYDKEVNANLASYNSNKKEYEERNIFTCMFGCDYQTWSEITLEKPVRPVRPASFSGYLIDDLEVDRGMGAFVSGELDITLDTDYNIKAFGVLGQVKETGQGFAKMYDPNVIDTSYTIVDEETECKMKCLMLSLYPTLANNDAPSVTGDFSMTISNAGFKDFVLIPDEMVSEPQQPAARLDEDKMWEFRVMADGAAYLSVATAATLAALTLY